MEKHTYEDVLHHAKLLLHWYFQGAVSRRHTKEALAKRATTTTVAMERDLSREERQALHDRLVKDLLSKS